MELREKIAEDLEDALDAISSASDYMANHHGLDHYGYAACLRAREAIDEALSIIRPA